MILNLEVLFHNCGVELAIYRVGKLVVTFYFITCKVLSTE